MIRNVINQCQSGADLVKRAGDMAAGPFVIRLGLSDLTAGCFYSGAFSQGMGEAGRAQAKPIVALCCLIAGLAWAYR